MRWLRRRRGWVWGRRQRTEGFHRYTFSRERGKRLRGVEVYASVPSACAHVHPVNATHPAGLKEKRS